MDVSAYYGIARAPGRCHIGHKPFAYPVPAWLLAFPLQITAGPGELLSIEEPTAGTQYDIREGASG